MKKTISLALLFCISYANIYSMKLEKNDNKKFPVKQQKPVKRINVKQIDKDKDKQRNLQRNQERKTKYRDYFEQ